MDKSKKLAAKYCRRVRRRIPINGTNKSKFLKNLREQVQLFLAASPTATMTQIQAWFGSPDEVAADYIRELSCHEIAGKFRRRNQLIGLAAAMAVTLFLIYSVVVVHTVAQYRQSQPHDSVVSITESDPVPITDAEK